MSYTYLEREYFVIVRPFANKFAGGLANRARVQDLCRDPPMQKPVVKTGSCIGDPEREY